jgi:hypothetical protein
VHGRDAQPPLYGPLAIDPAPFEQVPPVFDQIDHGQ